MLVLVLFIGMTSSAFAWSNVHTIGDLGELHDQLMRAVYVNPETGVSAIITYWNDYYYLRAFDITGQEILYKSGISRFAKGLAIFNDGKIMVTFTSNYTIYSPAGDVVNSRSFSNAYTSLN